MAKPDLDNGFLMLAHELFAAVMTAHMPQEARLVIVEVFSQIYGPAKLRTATLSPTEIGKRTGTHASSVARGIAFAVKHGIIRREGLGTYHFVKDYESWGAPDKPLLAPSMTSYAASATRLAMSHRHAKPAQTAPEKRADRINESVKESTEANELNDPPGLTDTLRIINGSVNPPPYRKNEEVVVVAEGEPETSTPLTSTASTSGDPPLWSMVPFRHDSAAVEAMASLCGELAGPDEDTIPGNVRRNCRSFPLWYFRYGIMRAIGKAGPGRVWSYAFGIMNNLFSRGILHESELTPAERLPVEAPSSAPPTPASRLTAFQAKQQKLVADLKARAEARRRAQSEETGT